MNDGYKIGLVGFFGWGNFGDELFVKVHQQYLGHLGVVEPINDLTAKPYFSRPVEEIVDEYDVLVIGGGDLVMPWAVSDLYWKLEYLKKPVFVTGVGVPTWRGKKESALEHYRKFLSSESVKSVSVRDRESLKWVKTHIAPDKELSWFPDIVSALDLPEPEQREEKTLGLVLRHRKNGGDDFRYVRSLCDRATMLGYKVEHIVLGSDAVGKADFKTASEFAKEGETIRYTEDILEMCRYIGGCTMLASMKFHGTVVATMYGIPSVVMSPTDKSRNWLRMIEREDLKSSFGDKELRHRITAYPASINSMTRGFLRDGAVSGLQALARSIETTLAEEKRA